MLLAFKQTPIMEDDDASANRKRQLFGNEYRNDGNGYGATESTPSSSPSASSLAHSSSAFTGRSSCVSLLSLLPENAVDSEYLVPIRDEPPKHNTNSYDEESTGTFGSEVSLSTLVSAWLPPPFEQQKNSEPQHKSSEQQSCKAFPPPTVPPATETTTPCATTAVVPLFFRLLGFHANPLSDSPDLRLAMLSNLSTSYNVVNISIAVQIMAGSDLYGGGGEESAAAHSVCSSALVAGMVVGQLLGGAVGDAVGRHFAMTLVMLLQIVASVGSAASFATKTLSVFQVLALWRFVLGIGCGGVYPLAATLTAESTAEKQSRGKLVALTFSMQGVGYLCVPIASLILIAVFGGASDSAWRFLLGTGAIPGIVQLVIRLQRRKRATACQNGKDTTFPGKGKNPESERRSIQKEDGMMGLRRSIQKEDGIARKLCGTALTWFLFDVLFYGNVLYQRVVLKAAFGSAETVLATVFHSLFIFSVALPGYFVSVARIGGEGGDSSPRYVQLQGFAAMTVLYAVIGMYFEELSRTRFLLLFLYGLTFFFSNYGPNSTTFMLPSMTFSATVRSTLNGVSAASGKAGALLGAMLFQPVSYALGDPAVMIICACVSLLGFYLTHACVSDAVGQAPANNASAQNEEESKEDAAMTGTPKLLHTKKEKTKLKRAHLSAPSLLDFWK